MSAYIVAEVGVNHNGNLGKVRTHSSSKLTVVVQLNFRVLKRKD